MELVNIYRYKEIQQQIDKLDLLATLGLVLIELLIDARIEAKTEGDYESADKLRDLLSSMGILLTDYGALNTTWDWK